MSGGALVGSVDAGAGGGGGVDGVPGGVVRLLVERDRSRPVGTGRPVGARRPVGSPLARWIVGHTVMLAVMAFAMIGGHSVARTGAAVLGFLGWAAFVAVRVRLGRLPADVHSVVDLLAMAAITAVPLLTAVGGGGHHGGVPGGAGTSGVSVGGAVGFATAAPVGAASVGSVLLASGVFAAWIVFRSGLRGGGTVAAAVADAVADAGTGVAAGATRRTVRGRVPIPASAEARRIALPVQATRLAAAGTAVTAASLGVMVLAIASGWH